MTGSGGHLAVRPELCDRCGKCVRACPQGRLRVGAGFIYVDVSACTSCFECVRVCERGAINRRSIPQRPVAHVIPAAPGEIGKVVVGSRAEAKALRKQAEVSRKAAEKNSGLFGRRAGEKEKAPSSLAASGHAQAQIVAGPVRWTLTDALAVAAMLALTLLAKQVVLGSEAVALMPPSGRVVTRSVVLAVFYAAQLGLLILLARRHGETMRSAFRLRFDRVERKEVVTSAALVAALLLGTRVLSTLWGAFAQAAGWAPPATEALTGVFGGGGAGMALAVAMVVVVGPVTEELAFRGVIAAALAQRLGLWPATIASAVIFSAYHLTAWIALPTFALGCALAWLALTRRTLLPAITLHVLYNGVVVAAAFWVPNG